MPGANAGRNHLRQDRALGRPDQQDNPKRREEESAHGGQARSGESELKIPSGERVGGIEPGGAMTKADEHAHARCQTEYRSNQNTVTIHDKSPEPQRILCGEAGLVQSDEIRRGGLDLQARMPDLRRCVHF